VPRDIERCRFRRREKIGAQAINRVTRFPGMLVLPRRTSLTWEGPTGKMIDDDVLNAWFVREVLPLERALTSYVRRNWRVAEDVFELRQDIYEYALIGARRELPANTRAYMYTLARNHLINHAKRSRIVSFEIIADLDGEFHDFDFLEVERALTARDELRHAKAGIEKLPPRCREVMRLRKLDGLSTQEAADKLGVSRETVRQQLKYGMKALIDHMVGGTGKIVRPKFGKRSANEARP
jgi:RNA polymerase sigma factor (sigma-70 family)